MVIKKLGRKIYEYFFIILGDFILALGVDFFLLPNQISTGGFSGLGTIINYVLGIKIGTTIILLNLILVVVSIWIYGFRFGIKTVISIAFFGLFANILEGRYVVTNDLLLASICGGTLSGIGIGLNMKVSSTTGGSELLAKISNHYIKKIDLTQMIVIIDGIIVILFILVFGNIDFGLYSIIAIFISKIVIDVIIEGVNYSKIVYVISNKSEMISEAIIQEMNRGVTLLDAQGFYTKQKNRVIYCVINKYEIQEIKDIVKKIDEQAFVIITEAKEVLGNGFN